MSSHAFDIDKWQTMSIFAQMGNIGSEVGRAFNALQRGDDLAMTGAFYRGLDLLDATMAELARDKSPRLREVARAREQFAAAIDSGNADRGLEAYFMHFAIAERMQR